MDQIVLCDYQLNAIARIKDNISRGNKMQTVMMPTGSGKTTIMLQLAKEFIGQGRRVLICTPYMLEAQHIKEYMGATPGIIDKLDAVPLAKVKDYKDKKYDIIFSDGALALYEFSNELITDEQKWIAKLNTIEAKLSHQEALSRSEKHFLWVNSLVELIKASDSFVVNFDNSANFGNFGYIPIVSERNVISFKRSSEDKLVDGWALTKEYDHVARLKRTAVLEGSVTADASRNFNSCIEALEQRLIKHMDQGLNSIDKKLDTLQLGLDRILKIVEEINARVEDKKDILSLYFTVHEEESEEADLFVTKVVDRLTRELVAKLSVLENQSKYIATDRLIRIRMGDNAWSKLDPASIKFLTTAKFMFEKNMDLEDRTDYSGVCLLASKAMEVELAKRFVVEYEKYLEDNGEALDNWPSAIVVYNKKDNTTTKLQRENFTLGNCSFITGMHGKNSSKNHKKFVEYCRERLLKGLSEEEISKTITEFNEYIECIRKRYRNPAAHKTLVTLSEASECMDYILEVERILKLMLERFSF